VFGAFLPRDTLSCFEVFREGGRGRSGFLSSIFMQKNQFTLINGQKPSDWLLLTGHWLNLFKNHSPENHP
jgi:hypothetical protein